MRIPRSARYVVIGAGIHGLSTGWHLAMELERRKQGRASHFRPSDQQIEKRRRQLRQHFGPLIPVRDHDQRPFGNLPQQNGVQRFGRGRQRW